MTQNGFTLVELLVVSGIIVFLSAIVFANWRGMEGDLLLQLSAHKLSQDIRRASDMALSGRKFSGEIPSGGYGLHLTLSENTSYKIYADLNGSQSFNPGDGVVETISFQKGVKISSLSRDNLSINFKPPNPFVTIGSLSTAQIELSLTQDPSKIKRVFVNSAGLVEVQ